MSLPHSPQNHTTKIKIKMPTVKRWCVVKPAKPTPNTGRMCISDCDQDKPITHAPTIFFYRPSTLSFPSAIQTLKNSLSQALVYFYPLAGRLHCIDGGRVELECNSMGAMFYEAESDAKIDDFKDFSPNSDVGALIPSVNYNEPLHQLPLLLVQITKFHCGGFSLGLAISHIMVDGTSGFHFTSEWARITRGDPLRITPFLDRAVLLGSDLPAHPLFDYEGFGSLPLLIGQSDDQVERTKESTVTMLHLSKIQVERLKKMANESQGTTYSRYEVVAGHIWRCTCKAREHKSEQLTKLRVAVNFRNRMQPPLTEGYFGNAIVRVLATSRAGELMTKPLSYASSRIREVTEMVSDEYVRSTLDFVKAQPDVGRGRTTHSVGSTQGVFYGNPNLEVTSWLGLPLADKDFGWGNEIYMGPGSLAFDGKSFIMPGYGENGSLSIPLRLQVAHMDNFIKFFYESLIE